MLCWQGPSLTAGIKDTLGQVGEAWLVPLGNPRPQTALARAAAGRCETTAFVAVISPLVPRSFIHLTVLNACYVLGPVQAPGRVTWGKKDVLPACLPRFCPILCPELSPSRSPGHSTEHLPTQPLGVYPVLILVSSFFSPFSVMWGRDWTPDSESSSF